MKSSEQVNELATALCKAQGDMGGAVKDSSNPFFKSSYADLTSVIKAIKQPFSDNGLSYTQFPVSNEHGVGVSTRLMHTSGQWLEMEYTLPTVKKDPQASGSAITYARRYALQSIAGIPTADDDAESAMLRGAANDTKINGTQAAKLKALLEVTQSDVNKFCKAFKCPTVDEMKAVQFDQALSALKRKADANS
ncbi:MAG: single-stranded DNA-binding protein [Woeseiaceae bacterium]|nr:single-stranded DNA-binding protein [Woeseiaceae bacterium]